MRQLLPGCVAAAVALSGASALAGTTTFDNGIEGWGLFFANDGVLGDFLEPADGNPGAHLRWFMVDTFGATLRNDTNPETIGDYTQIGASVRLAVDVRVESITFFGNEVPRNLIVELVDYNDDPENPYPSTSVWYNLGTISAALTSDWTSFEVVIEDTSSRQLPPGWGGTGAEDPVTFEPILPPDRSFASVLANVEEIRFTTFEPGFFYGFTNFSIAFDNPTVAAVADCLADMNGDGIVDDSDLGILLNSFGCSGPSNCPSIDGDGDVDDSDLGILLSVFGTDCNR